MTTIKCNPQNTFFTFSNWTLVGIIDSDGGFAYKLTLRKGNKVGFGLVTVITQAAANDAFLHDIHNQLGLSAKLQRKATGKLQNGQDKVSTVLNAAWTTKGGKKLLKIFKKCKPRCPGKYHDYLIGLVFLEILENKYVLKRVEHESWSHDTKVTVSAVAAIFLYFQKANELNPYSKTRKKESTPQEWLAHLQPSQFELAEGQKLYQTLMKEIDTKVEALRSAVKNI